MSKNESKHAYWIKGIEKPKKELTFDISYHIIATTFGDRFGHYLNILLNIDAGLRCKTENADKIKLKNGYFFFTKKKIKKLTGISEKNQKKIISVLEANQIIDTKVMGIAIGRSTHYRINYNVMLNIINGKSTFNKSLKIDKSNDRTLDNEDKVGDLVRLWNKKDNKHEHSFEYNDGKLHVTQTLKDIGTYISELENSAEIFITNNKIKNTKISSDSFDFNMIKNIIYKYMNSDKNSVIKSLREYLVCYRLKSSPFLEDYYKEVTESTAIALKVI